MEIISADMEVHLKIAGVAMIAISLVHISFPRYFKWKQELKALSVINRQLMLVHTFFIALMVMLIGCLCLSSPHELSSTELGKKISLGLGLFWTTRLITQFFGYSSATWKGKTFETTVHILFAFLWIYLSSIFLLIYFAN